MFEWLLKTLGSRKAPRADLYHPQERLIFTYFVGEGKPLKSADPMVLYRRMADVGPELHADLAVARSPLKDAKEGHAEAVRKIREIFSVGSLEEGGLTEIESVSLLNQFLFYCDSVKKKLDRPPTSAPAAPPSTASSRAGESPTSSSSASGSADAGPSTGSPPPSPTGPASPSASSAPA